MAQKTSNYNLIKPELKDAPPNITTLNPNFDIIDTELKKHAEQLATKETPKGAQAKADAAKDAAIAASNKALDLSQKHKLTMPDGKAFAVNSGNVDDIKTTGFYSITNGSVTGLPLATTGLLEVLNTVQRFTETPTMRTWKRRLNGSTWNAWVEDENASRKNAANGYMGLGADGRASYNNLPVDVAKKGQLLVNGTNLDDVKTEGTYYTNSAANANSMKNTPQDNVPFSLYVTVQTARIIQEFTTNDAVPRKFIRTFALSAWQAWREVAILDSNSKLPRVNTYNSLGGYGTEVTNLNTLYSVGVYSVSSTATGTPSSGEYGQVIVHVNSSETHNNANNWIWQMFYGTSGNTFVRRKVNNGAWQPWVPMWTGYNDASLFTTRGLIANNTDLNTLTTNGIYSFYRPSSVTYKNSPNVTFGILFVYKADTSTAYVKQEVIDITNGNIHVRTKTNIWTDWKNMSNADTVDGYHAADLAGGVPAFATTTGSGTAYVASFSPPFKKTNGRTVRVYIHANSGASPTLNADGTGATPIVKANGKAASNLKTGGIYTLTYSTVKSAFILQGEGGEYGTATAAEVLVGKTIGTENGLVNGTMPDKRNVASDAIGMATNGADIYLNTPEGYYNPVSSIRYREENLADTNNWRADRTMFGKAGTMPVKTAYTVPLSSAWNGTDVYVRIPHGAYMENGGEGYPEIVVPAHLARADGNIRAENIRSGVWIYGVQGTLQPKHYASGTTYVSAERVDVTGLGFRPFGFALYMAPPLSHYYIFCFFTGREYPFSGNGTASGGSYAADYYVNDNGFSAVSNYGQFGAGTYIWEAWG